MIAWIRGKRDIWLPIAGIIFLFGLIYAVLGWDEAQNLFYGNKVDANRKAVVLGGILFLAISSVLIILSKKGFLIHHFSLLIFSIVFVTGTLMAIIGPVCNGFDENPNFFKVIATLDGKGIQAEEYSYAISNSYLQLSQNVHLHWYESIFQQKWTLETTPVIGFDEGFAQCTYPAFFYVFMCMGVKLGQLLNLNIGWIYFLGRECNLLGYLLMTFVAFQLLPKEKKQYQYTLGLFATMPGVLLAASTYHPDIFVYGFSMIFFSYFLRLMGQEKARWWDLLILAFVFLVLVLAKYPCIALGFILLYLPASLFGSKKVKWAYLVTLAMVSLLLAAGWSLLVNSQFQETRVVGVNTTEQIWFCLRTFPKRFLTCIYSFLLSLLSTFSSVFFISGNQGYYLSSSFGVLFASVGIFGLIFNFSAKRMKERKINWLLLLAIFCFVMITEIALYISFNPVGYSGIIEGVQGRYFYSLVLALPFCFTTKDFDFSWDAGEVRINHGVVSFILMVIFYYIVTFFALI